MKENNTIDVGGKIDTIIKMLGEAKHIINDDELQRRRLTLAQMRLNKLINDSRAEPTYYNNYVERNEIETITCPNDFYIYLDTDEIITTPEDLQRILDSGVGVRFAFTECGRDDNLF